MGAIPETPTVLVTRPQPGADETAARLAAMGCRSMVLPLTQVAAVRVAEDPAIDAGIDAVVMTSGNAVRHAPDWLVERVAGKPAYTVGEATMAEARDRGFKAVQSADGDVGDLVALVSGAVNPGSRLLYLCGRMRAGNLEDALAGAGVTVRVMEVYRTEKVSHLTQKYADMIGNMPVWGALFHSAFSVRVFNGEWAEAESDPFERTAFFAISRRVAEGLEQRWPNAVHVAERPTEDALLSLVERTKSRAVR